MSASLPPNVDVGNLPALAPPPGVVPNYQDPPNRNDMAIPLISVCLAFTTIFFFIRCYSRFYKMRTWSIADILGAVAFILYIPYIWITFKMAFSIGYLVHQWDMTMNQMVEYLWIAFVGTEIYIPIIMFTKLAILTDWMQIFYPSGTKHDYVYRACQVMIVVNVVYAIIVFILTNVNCPQLSDNWDIISAPAGTCKWGMAQFGLSSPIVNLVLDVVLLLVPQKVIWGLKVSTGKKIGVSIIFLVGILGCISACIRLAYFVQYSQTADTTYGFSIVALCSLAEVTCAMLVLCVPNTAKAVSGLHFSRLYSSLKSWTSSRLGTASWASISQKRHSGNGHHARKESQYSSTGTYSSADPVFTEAQIPYTQTTVTAGGPPPPMAWTVPASNSFHGNMYSGSAITTETGFATTGSNRSMAPQIQGAGSFGHVDYPWTTTSPPPGH